MPAQRVSTSSGWAWNARMAAIGARLPRAEGYRACHMAMARPNARVSPVVVPAILFMA